MLRINPLTPNIESGQVNNNKNVKFQGTTASQSQQTVTEPQMTITPDYKVKKPMPYQKLDDLNIGMDKFAKQYKLANGQRVIIFPKEGKTVVKTYVNTGSLNEPDKQRGISHLIEHNLFNGSDGLEAGEAFKIVNEMGAGMNASTSFSVTDYFIASNIINDKNLEKQLQVQSSMIDSPLFLIDKLEKEKQVVNQEINMYMGYTDNLAINNSIKNLFQIETTSQDLIAGTTNNINNITREDIVNYFNNNYYPANMVTVITGEVDPDETMKLVSKYFTSTRQPSQSRLHEKLTPINKTVREDIISDKATATDIVMAFQGPRNDSIKDDIYLNAAARILSRTAKSRVNKELEKYNSDLFISQERLGTTPDSPSVVLFKASGTEDNSENILKTIYSGVQSLAINPPSEKEMTIVKKQMLKNQAQRYQYSAAINGMIGSAVLNNSPDYLKDYEKIVEEMTPQDIVNTVQKYLNLNKTAITVLHPASADKSSIENNYQKSVSFTGATTAKEKNNIIDTNKITHYSLDNNYRVALNNTDSPKADFEVHLLIENMTPQKAATLFILNDMLQEGTSQLEKGDFEEILDLNGTAMDIKSYYGGILVDGDCYAEDLPAALKSFSEVLSSPRITEETLNKAKSRIRSDISIREKTPYDKLDKEIYKNLPMGVTSSEILDSLDSVTLDDVKKVHKEILEKGIGTAVISAPFDKNAGLKNTVLEAVSQYPNAQKHKIIFKDIFEPINETKVLTESHNKNMAEIVECFKFKINNNMKDDLTIDLLCEILGGGSSSRLFSDLREDKKLAYWVGSNYRSNNNIGTFNLCIGTTTEDKEAGTTSFDNIQKSINGFNEHIQKLLTENVTDEELKNAKLQLKDDILCLKESQSGKTSAIISGIEDTNGVDQLNQKLKMIDEITVDDIRNAAKYIFNNKPTYSILATQNTLDFNKEFLDSLCA